MICVETPTEATLLEMGVSQWPIWTKEISEFPWFYDSNEVCYLLEGEAIVTPDQGEAVTILAGDLVRFDQGLSCTWKIVDPVRKHYNFF